MFENILSIITVVILLVNIIGSIIVIKTNKFKSKRNMYGIGVLIASIIFFILVNLRWFA